MIDFDPVVLKVMLQDLDACERLDYRTQPQFLQDHGELLRFILRELVKPPIENYEQPKAILT